MPLPRALWLLVMFATALGVMACSSSGTTVEEARQVEPTAAPTEPSLIGEAEPASQTESEDQPESMVPFPPPENLVEWPQLLELGNPVEMKAAALAHPLATLLPSEAELRTLFGTEFRIQFAEVVDEDGSSAVTTDECASNFSLSTALTHGIDVKYGGLNGQSVNVVLRQGPDVAELLGEIRDLSDCAPWDVTLMSPSLLENLGEPSSHMAFTISEADASDAFYIGFVAATSDDYLVAVTANAIARSGADANENALPQAVALMLDRLPAS